MIRQTNPVSWNVVVVTIDREDALQEVMEDVIGQVSVLPPGSGGAAEFSAGMLLAAGVVPQSKLESLVVEGSGEWNPARIGRHSREEVKQRFIGALQDPSHSERVFGVRYVVGEDNVVISMVHLERDSADSSETAVAMTPRDSSLGSSRANTAKAESVDDAPQNDRTPLLVIFRSRSGSMPRIPDQGTLWTAPTGPAA